MKSFMAFGAVLASAMLVGIATAQETNDAAPPPEQRAEDGERGDRRDRPNREEMRRRMLERFDADGNGELSDEEREQAREEMRERRRDDVRRRGDGPPREGRGPESRRGPGFQGPGPDPGGPLRHGPGVPPNPMRLFNAFDEDKNEQLSKDEFEKLMAKLREMAPPPGGPGPRVRGGRPDGPGLGEGRPPRPRDGERPRRPRRPEAEEPGAPAAEPAAEETSVDTTT